MSSPRPGRRAFLILLVIALAAGAYALRQRTRSEATAPVAAVAALELDAADIAVAREEALAATLQVSGLLQPLAESVLTASVEGRVQDVLARPGQAVAAGQVLARMDTRDLEARLLEQQANLAAARAQFELAASTHRRNEELKTRNFISANSLDNSRGALDAAREALHAREAQLTLARQALGKAVIRAPLAGYIAERSVQPGQQVGLNARLLTIVNLAELEFAATVPVAQIASVQIGQNVAVRAEGSPRNTAPLAGRVERIAPAADAATRMIPVYIRVANPQGLLKGGMSVRGEIGLGEVAGAVTLPLDALRDAGDAPRVLVVADGKVDSRPVRTGIVDAAGGRVEILSGVRAGETAILSRVTGIAAGQPIVLKAAVPPGLTFTPPASPPAPAPTAR